MKRSIAWCVIISFLLIFCADTTNNKLIMGEWKGAMWLIDGNPSNLKAAETHFSFDSLGNYTFRYAGNNEAGTYKVENDMLFTKPAGEKEIMVKIAKLTGDSLIFDMNRSGQSETLILTRGGQ